MKKSHNFTYKQNIITINQFYQLDTAHFIALKVETKKFLSVTHICLLANYLVS